MSQSAFLGVLLAAVCLATNARAWAATPTPAPGKILGLLPVPRLEPPPGPQDVLDAVNLTRAAGANGQFIGWTWRDLEPSPGTFRVEAVRDAIAYLGGLRQLTLLVGIQLINTTAKETPPDLIDVPFDSPHMRQRLLALLDAIAPHLTEQVRYLSIGNEVDVYLTTHQEWDAYQRLYDEAVAHMHAVRPQVQVGVTATFDGARGPEAARMAGLNASSDVVILTYYPTAEEPQAPRTNLPEMMALAGNRPVVLQEAGYPSSPLLSKSEEAQAEFITAVVGSWADAGEAMPFVSVFAMHDLTTAMCEDLAQYYGLPDNRAFKAFLCSLGLRRADGTRKLGWQAFVEAAAAAGFARDAVRDVVACVYRTPCTAEDLNGDLAVSVADLVAAVRLSAF